jgi:type IX secretion system substrate protein/WD40 repeat protein
MKIIKTKGIIIRIAMLCMLIFFTLNKVCLSQGINRTFLLGYLQSVIDTNATSPKARILFDSNIYTLLPESRKMSFNAAQATVSDPNGNLIIATNGCWVANASGDTMMNGSGLNPGLFTNNWCDPFSGIPWVHSNLLLPNPADSNEWILFHQTGNSSVGSMATEVYTSTIDMSLDGGLGGVTQKNNVVFTDTMYPGMAACRHGNGRDWWVIAMKDSSDIVFTMLLTPSGVSNLAAQSLNVPVGYGNITQPTFSQDGTKFAYTVLYGNAGNPYHDIRLFDFDRCTGMFSNPELMDISDSYTGLGVAFSSDSKYLYATSNQKLYQINTDTSNVGASVQVVAVNDGYYSPYPPFQTDFWLLYLAANGKIYISSGNSVLDMHYINYPDSGGVACDVQQHAIHLPCYNFRGNVNHSNYSLSAADGTICDSLGLNSTYELSEMEAVFKILPNPNDGVFSIDYLLSHNQSGMLEILDLSGRRVFTQKLPPWSSTQLINLDNIAKGFYQCVISSGSTRVSKKMIIE